MLEPKVIDRDEHSVSRKHFSESARKVLYRLNSKGYLGYLAGGAVRDILLDLDPKDFDVVTDARPNQIRKVFRNSRMIGRRFRLAHIYFQGEIIECATFRKQIDPEKEADELGKGFKQKDGMVVRDNIYGTPEEDALRRDFTVNALFYDISNFSVIDYVDGMRDLEAGLIRCIGDPLVRYEEDPVRMLRAIRFAAKLDFEIEDKTYAAIKKQKYLIRNASPARLYEEIQKLFFCGNAVKLLKHLRDTGLFKALFPEMDEFLVRNPAEGAWLHRVAQQFDKWRGAGKQITPPILFALLFGPLFEEQARKSGDGGRQNIKNSVAEQLNGMRDRVVIPKNIKYAVGYIMADQLRLINARNNKKAEKFLKNKGFGEAFVYFKLRSRHTGEHKEDLDWWEKRLKKT